MRTKDTLVLLLFMSPQGRRSLVRSGLERSGLVCRGGSGLHTAEQEEEWGGPADGAASYSTQIRGSAAALRQPPVGRISGFFSHCCSLAWRNRLGTGSELMKRITPETWRVAFIFCRDETSDGWVNVGTVKVIHCTGSWCHSYQCSGGKGRSNPSILWGSQNTLNKLDNFFAFEEKVGNMSTEFPSLKVFLILIKSQLEVRGEVLRVFTGFWCKNGSPGENDAHFSAQ